MVVERVENILQIICHGRHTFELNAVDNVANKGRPKVFNWITGIV